jgi:hypothetical protein
MLFNLSLAIVSRLKVGVKLILFVNVIYKMSLHVTIIFLGICCNLGPDFREESKSSQWMHGLLLTMTKDMSEKPYGF